MQVNLITSVLCVQNANTIIFLSNVLQKKYSSIQMTLNGKMNKNVLFKVIFTLISLKLFTDVVFRLKLDYWLMALM